MTLKSGLWVIKVTENGADRQIIYDFVLLLYLYLYFAPFTLKIL